MSIPVLMTPSYLYYMTAIECLVAMKLPKPARGVRFSSQVETIRPAGPLAFKEDLKELWYNPEDLRQFKLQVRKEIANSDTTPLSRGLENCTPNRLRHRLMAMQCTLSAQRKGMGGDYTASIARRCSSWSTELAFVQGCYDYYYVYHPSISKIIPSVNSISPPQFPFTMRKSRSQSKRVLSQDSLSQQQSRSVRRRVR
jgi:hypothetical protein